VESNVSGDLSVHVDTKTSGTQTDSPSNDHKADASPSEDPKVETPARGDFGLSGIRVLWVPPKLLCDGQCDQYQRNQKLREAFSIDEEEFLRKKDEAKRPTWDRYPLPLLDKLALDDLSARVADCEEKLVELVNKPGTIASQWFENCSSIKRWLLYQLGGYYQCTLDNQRGAVVMMKTVSSIAPRLSLSEALRQYKQHRYNEAALQQLAPDFVLNVFDLNAANTTAPQLKPVLKLIDGRFRITWINGAHAMVTFSDMEALEHAAQLIEAKFHIPMSVGDEPKPGSLRNRPRPKPQRQVIGWSSVVSNDSPSPWNCGSCTYTNSAQKQACEICGTPRPSAVTVDESLLVHSPGFIDTSLGRGDFRSSNAWEALADLEND
jgi:hypothetical protein